MAKESGIDGRMGKMLLLAALTVVLALAGEGDAHISRCFKKELPVEPDPEFSNGVARFSLQLFRRLAERAQAQEESLFVSPYSVWSSLCLAYLGSSGKTKRELADALRLSGKSGAYVNWKSLDEMLLDESTRQSGATFVTMNKGYFSDTLQLDSCLQKSLPELEVLDFSQASQTASVVNGDVEATTQGKIKDFLDPLLLSRANFILLNAIFFKGEWEFKFKPEDTTPMPFRVSPGREVGPIPMMTQTGEFKYAVNTPLNAKVLELPYADSNYSMYLLLPSSEAEGTAEVLSNLSKRNLETSLSLLQDASVRVQLPKFNLSTEIRNTLMTTLQDMGIMDLFSQQGDLTGFTVSQPLSVDETVHKATVEVTEEGTVAAAATSLIGIRVVPHQFVLDRPFVFLIMNRVVDLPVMAGVFITPPSS
ncbi:ovalbumin-related protein X-like [Penaeus chinensis]|uniref:ovalbumin-related protein X-like n=1 Tax=Penaeus chinensis TaxID=139456 RepID=UPI001FB5F3AC|nr:ovalbumin-related protein X-like [Penaeus chinensis]